jgi:hypothetical protein
MSDNFTLCDLNYLMPFYQLNQLHSMEYIELPRTEWKLGWKLKIKIMNILESVLSVWEKQDINHQDRTYKL